MMCTPVYHSLYFGMYEASKIFWAAALERE